ncbi:hypothetical protein TrRE_jg5088, partial [Triparma retinervis]
MNMSKEMAHFEAIMARKDAHPDEFRSVFVALAEKVELVKVATIEDQATILSNHKRIKSLEDEVQELRATALKSKTVKQAPQVAINDEIGHINTSKDNEIAVLRQKLDHLEGTAAAEVERLNTEAERANKEAERANEEVKR